MKKLLSLCIAISVFAISPSFAVDTSAKQAFMLDMGTGAVLLNKEGDTQMHPSSMSKMMTLYLIFDQVKSGKLKLDTKFTVSEKAWRKKGSKTFVRLNSQITVEDLIRGIAIQSGNDACIVAAEGISGSEAAFVKVMNKTARTLGMTRSHFVNATGWPDDNHQMSARDLAILSERLITDFPEYYPYFSEKVFTYNNIKQYNRNRLLSRMDSVDGLKTGHTEAAGYGIALSAKKKGRRLVLIINGLDSDKDRASEGRRLLEYGFRAFNNVTIAKKGEQVAFANVWMGAHPTVPLSVNRDVLATLPVDALETASFMLRYQAPLVAPIAQNTHVADLVIRFEGAEDQIIPLQAAVDMPKKSILGRILTGIKHRIM